jgi:PAS domain S-box-containing protein
MSSARPDPVRSRRPSHSRLGELILEYAADQAVITTDLDGVITGWNGAAERIMGWSEAEAIGRGVSMFLTPEDQAEDACGREMAQACCGERAVRERWHMRKDGSRFWASGCVARLEDEVTGAHIGYLRILRDRTAEHLTAERLRANETLLRNVLDNSGDCLKLLTVDGRLTFVNGPGLRKLEVGSFDEVRGKDYASLWPADEQRKVRAALAKAVAGRMGRFQGFGPTSTGTPRWWDVQVTPVPGNEGKPELLLISTRDVTERELSRDALRVSEERLRSALAIQTVGVMFWGPDFGLTEVNDAFLRMTGFSREEALGRTWQEMTPPEFHSSSQRAIAEVAATGEAAPYEKQYYRKDGSRWWGLFTARRIGHEVVEFVLDVTGRKEAEQALRDSEARFRALIAASAAAVWTTDTRGQLREDSPSWREFTGQSLDDLSNFGWLNAIHPDDQAQAEREWTTAITTGRPFESEYRLRHISGEWRVTAVRAVPIRNADGGVREWVGMNTDITAQRQAEEARRALEERYRLAIQATKDAIWDWDFRRNRIEWSEALHETYGYRPEDLVQTAEWWFEHVHPDDRERVNRSVHAVIDGAGSRWSDEYRFRRADGTYADILDRGFMVRGPSCEPVRMIGAMLDISERRQAERELRRLNEHLEVEVSRRAEQIRRQEEALRQSQKLEAIGQLTGGVAHDFNNLLTVIRSSAGLLRRADLPEERRRRYIEAISDTADRATKLTGQLLAFARRQPLKPEVFVVGDRIHTLADLVRPLMGGCVTIETSVECEGCAVNADPNQFETALVNLAVNARDAMKGEGRLGLRTWLASEVPPTRGHAGARGDFVAVSVSDTGSGIPPETMGRIFEPFFTTKEVGKGTGLGLSQVYGFAKQSGGELLVESEVGRGTTFTLYFPKVEAEVVAESSQSDEQAYAPASGRRNVLLVEDNTQVGEFAQQMLNDLGYAATWAPDARAALQLLEEDPSRFDVVFSDVVMPGMGGVELGNEVRRRWPNMPIILTSGYSQVLASGDARGFELLHKPYSAESLARVLRSVG